MSQCPPAHISGRLSAYLSDSAANGRDRLKAFLCEKIRVLLIRPESFGFSAYADYFRRLFELSNERPLVQTFRLFSFSAVKPPPDRGPRPDQNGWSPSVNHGSVHVQCVSIIMKALDLSTNDVTAGYLEKGKPTQADRYHNKMSRETEIIQMLRFFSCFLRG